MEKKFSNMSISSTEITKADSSIDISCTQFPHDFVFGVATSAYQHEGSAIKGGRGPSIWDVFALNAPGRIDDGSNGNVAADMYTKYKDDIKMMKSMGFDAYRFSISWSRILPGGRLCLGVNKDGIDYYNELINTVIANDMEPFVTLFHFDLPHSLQQEYDGFLSRDVADFFREFAELCFWEFGDRVKYWITLNEPWTYAHNGYVTRKFPPLGPGLTVAARARARAPAGLTTQTSSKMMNYIPYRGRPDHEQHQFLKAAAASNQINSSGSRQKWDPAKDPYTVGRNLLLAHAHAVHSYRTKFEEHQKGKIGIALNIFWCEPYKKGDADDIEAANRAMDFMLGWFLEPVLTGKYPKSMRDHVLPENLAPISDSEAELLKGSIDFLGLNYYTAIYAANNPHPKPDVQEGYPRDQKVQFSYTDPIGNLIGPQAGSDWLHIYPEGLYNLLTKYINDNYKNKIPPIYITENGVDEKSDYTLTAKDACVDSIREDYYKRHLVNLLKAMNKVNVKGYFAWSWCDNFEWTEGYTVRFGLIYVDYMNYLTRYPKASAIWFAKFLATKKFVRQDKKKESGQK
ncbi:Raucaffricine-O-beta-D-glucosidase [Sesamum alatum]|uniref:Raucaffricine-O-beta-D-glucosidase n=1 Tax=Sesamum alatum TaxID=300844 RepID=A0AAE1XJ25_9LAMI|nr:Raucaffricine-O-beta-D-glucosidase [Sesamum alatum]